MLNPISEVKSLAGYLAAALPNRNCRGLTPTAGKDRGDIRRGQSCDAPRRIAVTNQALAKVRQRHGAHNADSDCVIRSPSKL